VALFGMTALRQFRSLVEAVQKGEEIGGVKKQTIQIEAERVTALWASSCSMAAI